MYKSFNKSYYKNNILAKDILQQSTVRQILYNPEIPCFYGLKTLQERKLLKPTITRGKGVTVPYFSIEDVKDELLRREITCWKDDAIYNKELFSRKRYQKIKKRNKENYKPIIQTVVLVLDGEEWPLGKFKSTLVPKMSRIIKEIYQHKEIFREGNENYISPVWLAVIGAKINARNVKTFDPVAELMKIREAKLHTRKPGRKKNSLNKCNDGNQ